MNFISIFTLPLVLTSNIQTDETSTKESLHSEQNNIQKKCICVDDNSSRHMLEIYEFEPFELIYKIHGFKSLKYQTSCFCPNVTSDMFRLRQKDAFRNTCIRDEWNIYSVANNVYYVNVLRQIDNYERYNKIIDSKIADIKYVKPSSNGTDLCDLGLKIKITSEDGDFWYKRTYPLYTDDKIMHKYSVKIEDYLVKFMKELFRDAKAGYDFETIRMNREFKMLYMILEEMNIIGIKNRSPDITRYCEKAFNIYKAFIVGIELLRDTLDKF